MKKKKTNGDCHTAQIAVIQICKLLTNMRMWGKNCEKKEIVTYGETKNEN